MAKRKKRKSAGPPPVHNPKRAALEASGEAAKPSSPKLKPGEPAPPSMRGVLIRAGIVAALFYPYLVYVVGSSPGGALFVTIVAFALMIPLGILLDRYRYKRQMRKWEEKRAGQSRR